MTRIQVRHVLQFALAALSLGVFALLPWYGAATGRPWLSLAVTFLLIPLLDAWVGHPHQGSATVDMPRALAAWLPRLHVALQAALLALALLLLPSLSPQAQAFFALAVGTVTGGIGITVAHELGHRASRLDRVLARMLLVSVGYGHFHVEHNRGHHVRVATPDDPASAPRGMHVYRFILRSVTGGFLHAWRLEAMRLGARGRSALHPSNWVLTGTLLWLGLVTAAGAGLGFAAALFLVGQAACAAVLLEIVNYIEHYGLQRHRLVSGRLEPVAPHHSWNADFTISNWLLFNLQLHSDHHAHVQRPFEALRTMPQAPQLPAGYPTLVLAALLPPLWFALMDRRIPPTAAPLQAVA